MMNQNTIVVRPIEAQLTHNVELLGRMDPYVVLRLGGETAKSQICKDGGKTPQWTDTLVIPKGIDNLLTVEVFNDNMIRKDKLVGACDVNLATFLTGGSIYDWFEIFYQGKPAGKILLSITDQSVTPISNIGAPITGAQTLGAFGMAQPIGVTQHVGQPIYANPPIVGNQLLGHMTIGTENRVVEPIFPTDKTGFDTNYIPPIQSGIHHHHHMGTGYSGTGMTGTTITGTGVPMTGFTGTTGYTTTATTGLVGTTGLVNQGFNQEEAIRAANTVITTGLGQAVAEEMSHQHPQSFTSNVGFVGQPMGQQFASGVTTQQFGSTSENVTEILSPTRQAQAEIQGPGHGVKLPTQYAAQPGSSYTGNI